MATVADIVALIEELADPAFAAEWDNCGLLAGNGKAEVNKIMVCLDPTAEVISEAAKQNCQMLISHHPLIFKAVKKVTTDTFEGEALSLLYKNNMALYCAHTSLDCAPGGVNDVLCKKLNLKEVTLLAPFTVNGKTAAWGRRGILPAPLSGNELIQYLVQKLGNIQPRAVNVADKQRISSVALCSGAGEEFAFDPSADVFLTGELKYHTALELKRQGRAIVACGHYETEVPVVKELSSYLQNRICMLQYPVTVVEAKTVTDPFD